MPFVTAEEATCDRLIASSCIVGNKWVPGFEKQSSGLTISALQISPLIFHINILFSKSSAFITHNAAWPLSDISGATKSSILLFSLMMSNSCWQSASEVYTSMSEAPSIKGWVHESLSTQPHADRKTEEFHKHFWSFTTNGVAALSSATTSDSDFLNISKNNKIHTAHAAICSLCKPWDPKL